jgi:hypothetical protein
MGYGSFSRVSPEPVGRAQVLPWAWHGRRVRGCDRLVDHLGCRLGTQLAPAGEEELPSR